MKINIPCPSHSVFVRKRRKSEKKPQKHLEWKDFISYLPSISADLQQTHVHTNNIDTSWMPHSLATWANRMECFNQAELAENQSFEINPAETMVWFSIFFPISVNFQFARQNWRKYNSVLWSFNCHISLPRQLSASSWEPLLITRILCESASLAYSGFHSSESHFKIFPRPWLIDNKIIHNFYASNLNYFYIIVGGWWKERWWALRGYNITCQ